MSKGKKFSLDFYQKRAHEKAKTFNKPRPLSEFLVGLIGDKQEVHIADLGAGMFPIFGNYLDGKCIHLYSSDFLAVEYMKILQQLGIEPLIPIEYQDMTKLTHQSDFFDVVCCINALDHCEDPKAALQEIYRVCKNGGWIYLQHHTESGIKNRYMGMHFWNVDMDDEGGDSFFFSQEEKFFLSEVIPGFSNEREEIDRSHYITSRFQK